MPFFGVGDRQCTFTGIIRLTGGKFAMVEKSHEFTLVPWQPGIDRQLGRRIFGRKNEGRQESAARCSRNAAANVRNASRDLVSVSVECSTISDDGRSGSPKRWLTSTVPGGASR